MTPDRYLDVLDVLEDLDVLDVFHAKDAFGCFGKNYRAICRKAGKCPRPETTA
jgi:hypothetical protein